MAHDVFISHSSKDRAPAEAVCAALEAHGIGCWMAARDILPSADWGASIVRAIADAKLFLLIFSENANLSQHVVREVERAVNRGLPIIPVRIEEITPSASLEYFLNTPHWLDAFKPPFDQHLDYVVRVVALLIAGGDRVAAPVGPPPSPGVAGAAPAAAAPPARPLRPAPWALFVGGVVVLGVLAAAGVQLMAPRPSTAPPVDTRVAADPMCLAATPGVVNATTCRAILDQNAAWQGCAASYADGDIAARVSKARTLIASGRTGADLYEATPAFRDYGAISHYWETLGECVAGDYVKFDDVSGSMPFPQSYWDKTRPLRRTIGPNWNGQGQPLPDFMSNFQALCRRYKAAREAARPGGGQTLDCSL